MSKTPLCFLVLLSVATAAPLKAQLTFSQVLWSQDFNSALNVAAVTGSGFGLFDGITSSGPNFNWSITGGDLQATRTGNAGSATISSMNFQGSLGATALNVRATIRVPSITATGTTSIYFGLGQGFTNANAHPANTDTHSDFSINLTSTAPTIQFRDHDNTTNLGSPISSTGDIQISWFINNTGADINYYDPTGNPATLINDRWTLWINTGSGWTALATNPTNTNNVVTNRLDDLKITWVNGSGTFVLRDLSVWAVPEPSAIAGLGLFALLGVAVVIRISRKANA